MAKRRPASKNKRTCGADAKILELAVMGHSLSMIARTLGITESLVQVRLRRELDRAPLLTLAQRRKMLALRLTKVSQHASALMFSDDRAMKWRGISATLLIAEREERLLELEARESKAEANDPNDFQIPLAVARAMYHDIKPREASAQSEPRARQSRPEPDKDLEEALDRLGPITVKKLRRLRPMPIQQETCQAPKP